MFEALLARLARSLDGAGLPYMIIGGQAVLLYGEPRLTQDIDVTLGAAPEQLPRVLKVAKATGLKPLVDPEPFVHETMVLPCQDTDTGIRVDLIFSFSPYEDEALRRVRTVEVGGARVRFASPEDVIVHKIVAGRPRDLEDVKSILLKNAGLDASYVRRWLGEYAAALDRPLVQHFERLIEQTRL